MRIKAVKKAVKKATKNKGLKLDGEEPDYSKFKIRKNQPVPTSYHGASYWDHLLDKLDKGDTIETNQKEGMSICNRARNLGFVIVMRKQGEDEYLVWFGGMEK